MFKTYLRRTASPGIGCVSEGKAKGWGTLSFGPRRVLAESDRIGSGAL